MQPQTTNHFDTLREESEGKEEEATKEDQQTTS